MNSDTQDFEPLRKLLALKRHEQPPPGYFSRLPGEIADRIERGECQLGFWEKFLAGFHFRPAFAYSFSLAAFGALTFSVISSVTTQPQAFSEPLAGNRWRSVTPEDAMAAQSNPSEPLHVANWMRNINSSNLAPALPSLFVSRAYSPSVRVSFTSP